MSVTHRKDGSSRGPPPQLLAMFASSPIGTGGPCIAVSASPEEAYRGPTPAAPAASGIGPRWQFLGYKPLVTLKSRVLACRSSLGTGGPQPTFAATTRLREPLPSAQRNGLEIQGCFSTA